MSKSITIDATKRGLPAIWETGGGLTSGGSATIIAKSDGTKPRAVFVRARGHLSGGPHALICVHEGFYLVQAGVGRGVRQSARIERIVRTSVKDVHGEKFEATAEVEVVNTFSCGEWDKPLEAKFEAAVEAAFGKASTYHCRYAVYIDTSERKPDSDEQRKRREAEMAKQDAERARLRAEKTAADTKAKAEAEAASREAKASGLGVRIEAAQVRLNALRSSNTGTSYSKLELGESYFVFGWGDKLYTEANVAEVERNVAYWEEQVVEKLRKQMARAEFQPQYEAFVSRVEDLGLTLSFGEEKANWEGGSYYGGFTYSREGLDTFAAELTEKERVAAEAAARQAELDSVADAAALTDFGGSRRRMGVNNQQDWWVIRPDGSFRVDEESSSRYEVCQKSWRAVGADELALHYQRSDRYDIAHCEVVYRPPTVTRQQLAAVKQIEEELEASENAFGLDDRLGKLIDRRTLAIEDAMAALPQPLLPEAGWDYQALVSANGVSVGGGKSWVDHAEPFDENCEGREAQAVYVAPAADGELVALAYYKWGGWNVNLLWRETTSGSPVERQEPKESASAEPVDMETALQRLQDKFGTNR